MGIQPGGHNMMDLDQLTWVATYIQTAQVYSVTERELGEDPSRCPGDTQISFW